MFGHMTTSHTISHFVLKLPVMLINEKEVRAVQHIVYNS